MAHRKYMHAPQFIEISKQIGEPWELTTMFSSRSNEFAFGTFPKWVISVEQDGDTYITMLWYSYLGNYTPSVYPTLTYTSETKVFPHSIDKIVSHLNLIADILKNPEMADVATQEANELIKSRLF
jgi:hypothetical protein